MYRERESEGKEREGERVVCIHAHTWIDRGALIFDDSSLSSRGRDINFRHRIIVRPSVRPSGKNILSSRSFDRTRSKNKSG